jgi:hypothetical protein
MKIIRYFQAIFPITYIAFKYSLRRLNMVYYGHNLVTPNFRAVQPKAVELTLDPLIESCIIMGQINFKRPMGTL